MDTIEHNSTKYHLITENPHPRTSFVCDRINANGYDADYQFQLIGGHVGPPINVWLTKVHRKYIYDEENGDTIGSYGSCYEILWVDDETELDMNFQHAYSDVLCAELTDIIHETWD